MTAPSYAQLTRAAPLLSADGMSDGDGVALLASLGFDDPGTAGVRFRELCRDDGSRQALGECLPMLLAALSEAATPDGSLVNFERFVQSVEDRAALFRYLADNPRAVEILIKLFVGSQFLTEILLRSPGYLERLTQHKRLAEHKSRGDLIEEAHAAAAGATIAERLDALRRFQKWELLRIGACDTFGLFDLKSVTVQLSLLADSLAQVCLEVLAADVGIAPDGFAVLGFGKLGGEELNYSSDIDLVFLADEEATRFWPLGQRLIQALSNATGEGFLYRVDMRLRPWGSSGSLVNTVDAHMGYLKKHGQQWERQALVKARTIAGDDAVGRRFLERVEPLIFSVPADDVRENVRQMKGRIEKELEKQGRQWGEIKSGQGSIRDVEFVTQCLQLVYGGKQPEVRSIGTLAGLARLADFGFLQADEYRHLTTGYLFLRKVEHCLQLMHYKQTHSLPVSDREQAYLARRLDFPDAEAFLDNYRRHCLEIRRIYEKYVVRGEEAGGDEPAAAAVAAAISHVDLMAPSYAETFAEDQIARHAALLKKLSIDNPVEVAAEPLDADRWRVTIVGFNHRGELSLMCGLLFVYGFNIVEGNIFTAEQVAAGRSGRTSRAKTEVERRQFVNAFTVDPPLDVVLPDVWPRYKTDLSEMVELLRSGHRREAQGRLAKRAAGALREVPELSDTLFPVDIRIDNDADEPTTVLHIEAEDTHGFLYELTNALALFGVEVERVAVRSVGDQVSDMLWITDANGEKITDEERQRELRAAIVLTKHFTHLLPRSPNPEAALLHFRDFLDQLFQRPDWVHEFHSLEQSAVLEGLARLLGVSNFLWEDFLRLQHDNLFPVVADVQALSARKTRDELTAELTAEMAGAQDFNAARERLNAFKDREMFRIDMRHILGRVEEFGQFAEELSDLAEVVVAESTSLCLAPLIERYGRPRVDGDRQCPFAVCALGKCGGRELGFASDIELMFVYEADGRTDRKQSISNTEFFVKLVESFTHVINARQEGIFQVDLRLRPYGSAGPLAVSLDAFRSYFAPTGAAWPYERQALVKLRPIAGDPNFGRQVVEVRDELIFTGEPFDVAAMRAMREKQFRQLVKAGTFNAKLSPGGLVDCEYLVQGLQITHGKDHLSLRTRSTRKAIRALRQLGVLSAAQADTLMQAYVFLRRLIDALRVVRGHAKDLTVPPVDGEEYEFLARRLDYGNDPRSLQSDLETHTSRVREIGDLLHATEPGVGPTRA